jgi:enterochelin esterase-like enzyme
MFRIVPRRSNQKAFRMFAGWFLRGRSLAAVALATLFLAACGGGGGGSAGAAPQMEGSLQTLALASRNTATTYPLNVYLPPASAGPAAALPVIYALDGESWFMTLVNQAEATHLRAIIIGVQTAGQRSRDYVPVNNCTGSGGGHAAYFDFLRQELIPYVEANLGGDPKRRVLFGHSHGGSFVLYALFTDAVQPRTFSAYLASDSSIDCMPQATYGWEGAYAAAHTDLPTRLQLTYATQGNRAPNIAFAGQVAQRSYPGLALEVREYAGTHGGIVPQVLADGVPFALRTAP